MLERIVVETFAASPKGRANIRRLEEEEDE